MTQGRQSEGDAALNKLRDTLRFWQKWEAEYAGLWDELEAEDLEPDASRMTEIAESYGSAVVDLKEFQSMLHTANQRPRTRAQILNIIKDRVKLAERNASTIARQIALLDPPTFPALHESQGTDEEQLEITEQLDDDDVVVSSKIENYAELMKRMQADLNVNIASTAKTKAENQTITDLESPVPIVNRVDDETQSLSKPIDEAAQPFSPIANKPLLSSALHKIDKADPAVDLTASEVRKNLDGLRPIVASLDLQDDESEDDYAADDDSWEENEYGMHNISDEMDEGYIEQMQALVEKYDMKIAGPSEDFAAGLASRIVQPVQSSQTSDEMLDSSSTRFDHRQDVKSKPRKAVRFAEKLDHSPSSIAPLVNNANGSNTRSAPTSSITPMTDFVVEKSLVRHFSPPRQLFADSPGKAVLDLSRAHDGPTPCVKPSQSDLVSAEDQKALDFEREMALYSHRVGRDDVDVRAFNDPLAQSVDSSGVEGRRISKFKAARLGLREA